MFSNVSKLTTKCIGTLALAAVIACGVSVPRPSHALMAIVFDTDILERGNAGDVILCLVLLPFCLLDKDAQGLQVSEQTLLDNGYSSTEIRDIRAGQDMFMQAVADGRFHVAKKVLAQPFALSVELQKQIPGIPQTYVEFVKNN